jgi:glycosyltransferase involved in cell wall biosynthesis
MKRGLSGVQGFRRLRALIRESDADVVQAWMYFGNVMASLAARGSGVPVVWSIHAATFEHLGLPSRISAHVGGWRARQLAAFVINCSERSTECHRKFGYGAAPTRIIANGYDPSTFFPDETARATMRGSLGLDADSFVIGTISRWHEEKDVPTLLRALAKLGDPQIQCVLIGPGLDDANSELSSLIAELGIGPQTMALGSRDDVPQLARALDLHVLPSRTEAFPNVVAETMLSGVPNLVTDVGDSALIVGETGWIVPRRDPASMAEAITEAYRCCVGMKSAWERRRSDARKRIEDSFSFRRMAEAYREVWERVARG